MALIAVSVTYLAYCFYQYSLNVAAPQVAADLNGMALFSWAISIPALASALATLIFGKLSDMYGRRNVMIASLSFFLLGSVLSAMSQDFVFNIAARFILALGQGALAPLIFSVLGDLFDPAERSKWSGLLAIPAGITAFIAPTLVGMVADSLSWRYFFWLLALTAIISGAFVLIGVPSLKQRSEHKIDFLGAVLLTFASATTIVGFSWAGTTYPWGSIQIIGTLGIAIVGWGLFLWTESQAAEPMLDLQVLTNRTFITAALAALMSFFGLMGITAYYPLFLQGVQNASATLSGQMITPFSVLMSFMGVPAGFLLAKTKRYKWMYVIGYAILTVAMFGMMTFGVDTPIWLGVLVTALAGLGLGTIPTINTLVAQFAVPRRLLGAATGAIFFFVMMGMAIAPAILGSAMNASYASALQNALPAELQKSADPATLSAIGDPRVLLSPQAMTTLKESFARQGAQGSALFDQTVVAIRSALEASLKTVYLIGAVTMLLSFLMILTIPEISM
ncbi:MAG: MFS transporter [Chloroflexi bacterium]|nr:MFS transporter [Chloroflexota bacterium]